MPRWLIITLVLMMTGLVVYGLMDTSSPVSSSASTSPTCPLPPLYRKADEPRQSTVSPSMKTFSLNGAAVMPVAGFSLQARVLSREDYRFDEGAEFSPIDLALGWGPMAEPGIAQKLNISQSGRFYRYSWGNEGPPMSPQDIITNSANMHMVPADDAVAKQLERVANNDVIALHGWLIRIEKPNGWRWQSSLSRNDSGNGACELIYVCALEIK
jgi:hypothetical protein